ARNAVAVVVSRVHAGVELEPLLDQDVQRPQALPRDRETRGAVRGHALARDVLQKVARAAQVGAELPGCLPVDQVVPVAVTRDLVAGRLDRAHQPAMPLGHPAQDKESRLYRRPLQYLQELARAADD